jgi:hypothetical protein
MGRVEVGWSKLRDAGHGMLSMGEGTLWESGRGTGAESEGFLSLRAFCLALPAHIVITTLKDS